MFISGGYQGYSSVWLERQVVALEAEGSSPSSHPKNHPSSSGPDGAAFRCGPGPDRSPSLIVDDHPSRPAAEGLGRAGLI